MLLYICISYNLLYAVISIVDEIIHICILICLYYILNLYVILKKNSFFILISFYFFITCFSFSASIPAIANKINPGIPKGIPKKVAVVNTNIP